MCGIAFEGDWWVWKKDKRGIDGCSVKHGDGGSSDH